GPIEAGERRSSVETAQHPRGVHRLLPGLGAAHSVLRTLGRCAHHPAGRVGVGGELLFDRAADRGVVEIPFHPVTGAETLRGHHDTDKSADCLCIAMWSDSSLRISYCGSSGLQRRIRPWNSTSCVCFLSTTPLTTPASEFHCTRSPLRNPVIGPAPLTVRSRIGRRHRVDTAHARPAQVYPPTLPGTPAGPDDPA